MDRDTMIVAGFGFRANASLDALVNALHNTGGTPDALAAPADKCTSIAIRHLADDLNLPLIAVQADALQSVKTHTQSPISQSARNTGSVAEAAALAAAGANATLLTPRRVSDDRMATCALAQAAPNTAQDQEEKNQ
jgi:cobalt-precorrin 5A hydrolase